MFVKHVNLFEKYIWPLSVISFFLLLLAVSGV
jgi:hypothetical protein